MEKFDNVSDYIDSFPPTIKKKLKQMRSIIRKTASDAEEVISYGMPGYKLNGMLVWFGGYKTHIGFYPKSHVIELFSDKLKKYKTSKGTIQFPIDEELPEALIEKIVRYRMKENNEKLLKK